MRSPPPPRPTPAVEGRKTIHLTTTEWRTRFQPSSHLNLPMALKKAKAIELDIASVTSLPTVRTQLLSKSNSLGLWEWQLMLWWRLPPRPI